MPTVTPTADMRQPAKLLTLAVLLVGLGLTALATYLTQQAVHTMARDRFETKFDRLDEVIRAEFKPVELSIQGLKGLYAADGRLDAPNLEAWVAAHDLQQLYPGVRHLGLLSASGPSKDKFAVSLIAPPGGTTLGTLANAINRNSSDAVQQAVDFGDPVLSRAGDDFVYLMPLYRSTGNPANTSTEVFLTPEQRRELLVGVLFASFAMDRLLDESISSAEGLVDYEVFDGTSPEAGSLVFSSLANLRVTGSAVQPTRFSERAYAVERRLLIHGRVLLLRAGASNTFMQTVPHSNPAFAAALGALLSAILAYGFWRLSLLRYQARQLAGQQSQTLDRMSRVLRSTSHVVVQFTPAGKVAWVNDALQSRMKTQAIVGMSLQEVFITEPKHQGLLDTLSHAHHQQTGARVQLPLIFGDAAPCWFDLDFRPERNEQEEVTGFMAIASDINALREAEQQMAASLRENQSLMDAIDQHAIVSVTDHRGVITYANELFALISGYSRDELIGQNHRILKSDEHNALFYHHLWTSISTGYPWKGVICNRAKDGSLYWVDAAITPMFDDAGNIEKYISIRTDVTATRVAQDALALERERLKAILQGTNAGTWEWNVATGELKVNARWAEIIGSTLQELGPLSVDTWSTYCHPVDLEQAQVLLQRHFAGELDNYEFEFRMCHSNGDWVWVQTRGRVHSWLSDGQPEWMSGIHLDITLQKQLQSQQEENARIWQSVLDNLPVALSVFDADLRLILHNQKFRDVLEFPDSLFSGAVTTFEQLIRFNAARGEYGRGEIESTIQQIIDRARVPMAHKFERIRPNGVALEVRGAPIPGGGLITTYVDISERLAAQAEINQAGALLQSVLDAASEDSAIAIDLSGTITLFNKGAERLFGYKAEEVVNRLTPLVVFDPDELQARASVLSIHLGETVTGLASLIHERVLGKRSEWTLVRKDGSTFPAALTVTPINSPDGQRSGYLAMSHDITQEKRNEARLQAAVEAAEQAANAKGQFLANMSHEIRTPMNAILGMLKLLKRTPLQERQLDYATKSESAARSLLGLLNDILDFSKAEAGKMVLDARPFRMDQLFRDLTVVLQANLTKPGVELVLDLDPALPSTLVGDDLRLQQILINLGGNAIKFTESGEVLVRARLEHVAEGRAMVHFSVKDSGIGIDPKNHQHIFAGFSQAEASTTRRFGGTGLGLSICRRLVELMDGALTIDSALGKGSTFAFRIALPIAAKELLPAAEETKANLASTQPLAGMRILVVEDNLINQQVARELLTAEGAEVTLAGNGELGVQAIEGADPQFHAVLMDLQMPVMDGYTASVTVRHELGLTTLPIIAMTANAMASDREACLAAGMDDHIGKPFDLHELVALLLHHTGHLPPPSAVLPAAAAPVSASPAGPVLLDQAGALDMLGGNEDLYADIGRSYLQEIAQLPARLAPWLNGVPPEEALRELHTLKGLSLTVGANRLSAACKEGELAVRDAIASQRSLEPTQRVQLQQNITRCVEETTAAMLAVLPALPAASSQATAGGTSASSALDPEALQRDLHTLRRALADSDMKALDLHAALRKAYDGGAQGRLDALHGCISSFDFAKAVVECDALLSELQSPV